MEITSRTIKSTLHVHMKYTYSNIKPLHCFSMRKIDLSPYYMFSTSIHHKSWVRSQDADYVHLIGVIHALKCTEIHIQKN